MTPAVDLPLAGTVVVLRDGALGAEVLLMRRPDRGSFAGGWAFPGGKVEAADAVEDCDALIAARETCLLYTSPSPRD